MEASSSNSSGAAILAHATTIQKELLALLEKVVQLMIVGALVDLQNLAEFQDLIRRLWERAPDSASAFAIAILEQSPRDGIQQVPATTEPKDGEVVKRNRKPNRDSTYRPSRTIKMQVNTSNPHRDGDGDGDGDGGDKDTSETLQANGGADMTTTKTSLLSDSRHHKAQKKLVSWTKDVSVDGDKIGEGVDWNTTGSIETTKTTSAPNMIQSRPPNFLYLVSETAPVGPATPTEWSGTMRPSPQTEEIHRAKTTTSFESISSSPESVPGPSLSEAAPLKDMILEAVRIIHQFGRYPCAVPVEVHSIILQTLQKDNQDAIVASNLNQWSDGSMWMQVLEMGSTQNHRVTILNMLEYMGAWEWYDKQIELSQMTFRTKKSKLVDRRGASTRVLDKMQSMPLISGAQERWISGVGMVTLTKEGEAGNPQARGDDQSVAQREKQAQRKRISMQLSRGRKLSTKLVKELGLGILLSPKIWDYTKKSCEQLDILINGIQADFGRMKLLQILGKQLEQLVIEGHPDLGAFYDALNEERLLSQEELLELRRIFASDSDAITQATLDVAVDSLIENVGTKVLGKRQLEDHDSVTVNNNVELSCDMFHRLRREQWFDDWMMMAAMDISDKPFFVRHGKSIPLDDVGRTRKITPFVRPLAAWARKTIELRQQARNMFGDSIRLVYFCPLNHKNNHFTLLEINEREEAIRHYDSMAEKNVLSGTAQLTKVGRLVKTEFADLKYMYSEAPTPQQTDDWSCGVRVVWNFRRLSNSLPIGGWKTSTNPERMKMEIVEGLVACVEANAMTKVSEESSKPKRLRKRS